VHIFFVTLETNLITWNGKIGQKLEKWNMFEISSTWVPNQTFMYDTCDFGVTHIKFKNQCTPFVLKLIQDFQIYLSQIKLNIAQEINFLQFDWQQLKLVWTPQCKKNLRIPCSRDYIAIPSLQRELKCNL